ncbi:AI-2E family transporter [Aromatoleum toluclasticum]|uniref:AI-2E family transporter n=1 Tax=Aromatoleum toluclasticum TaxID=92003 RepID=UPI0003758C52|nr:AI-2E family transporter [Aromatoleum toluclasticum]
MQLRSRSAVEFASFAVMAMLAAFVLLHHMVAALFAGILTSQFITLLANGIFGRVSHKHSKALAALAVLLGLSGIVAGAVMLGVFATRGMSGEFGSLLEKMAAIIAKAETLLPAVVVENLPRSAADLKQAMSDALRHNADQLGNIGKGTASTVVHVLLAVVIGAMVAFHRFVDAAKTRPFAQALRTRIGYFTRSVSNVVFAQARISAINTTLTAIYLALVLPLLGHPLPYTKTMIAITFLAGLLPVIGNLISNTVIVVVSAGAAPIVAVWSLAFLVLIHKLEYFINARIVGSRINAAAWELLLAMLIMDTLFGVGGLVLAPILYAYAKAELAARELL